MNKYLISYQDSRFDGNISNEIVEWDQLSEENVNRFQRYDNFKNCWNKIIAITKLDE